MTEYTHFYIDKTAQPFADNMLAFGLAEFVASLSWEQGEESSDITLIDSGTCIVLALSQPLHIEAIETVGEVALAKAIATPKTKLPETIVTIDYEEQREKANLYYQTRNDDEPSAKPEHWDVLRAINPQALPGYNSLMEQWHIASQHPETYRIVLDLFANFPNDIDSAIDRWKALDKEMEWGIKSDATLQQLYNPDSGKGQNRTKANGISIGNMKSLWLIEYLKAVGFYEGAMTRQVRGAKDRKTFVISPRRLSRNEHRYIMAKFLDDMPYSETSTRFDILANVRYSRALLAYLEETLSTRDRRRRNLRQRFVSGFNTVFYKDMGNAVATMNLAFMALPGWIEVESHEDANVYRSILDELEQITRQFDESHSDAFDLLQHLRDFVSGDDLAAFFRFTNGFASYYTGMRERGQYAYQLNTDFIERLIMSIDKPLAPILQNEGFQNIAYAIRQSTVTAQYRKGQGDRKYDVRYGLGQQLARKARYPQDFIAELSEFLHLYNAETARVMETRSAPYRRSIRTSDIDEIVALIDEYGSQTIANMLIAYGYARVPREENTDENNQQ